MDEKDAIIEKLTRQVTTLLARVEQLEDEIARLKKDSNNSSKPPSSDIVKPSQTARPTRGKRKRGGQPGHQKHSREPFAPEEIDHTIHYELPANEAHGLIPLNQWHRVQQITLEV